MRTALNEMARNSKFNFEGRQTGLSDRQIGLSNSELGTGGTRPLSTCIHQAVITLTSFTKLIHISMPIEMKKLTRNLEEKVTRSKSKKDLKYLKTDLCPAAYLLGPAKCCHTAWKTTLDTWCHVAGGKFA